MDQIRVFLSLAWLMAGIVLTETRNDSFIAFAFRWGAVSSMGLALLSGLIWALVGYWLVSPKHRKGAVILSLALVVPLLSLKGYRGVAEMQMALTDPDYYATRGVGPVDQVALLGQAGGVLLAGLMQWRAIHRAKKLPAEFFSEEPEKL